MQPRIYALNVFIIALVPIILVRLFHLYSSDFNLFFDEAQYWFWANNLDWGYYSKPPMVAWLIAATTAFCGDGEGCIRLSSTLLHGGTSIIVYLIAKEIYDEKTAFWSAITFITLPAVTLSSHLASTDPALMFFWSASMYGLIRATKDNNILWWLFTAVVAGFGLLSKYNMAIFAVSALWYMLATNKCKAQLKDYKIWLASGIAFLIFLPNILWNYNNHFVSFLHTKDNAALEGSLLHFGEMLEFIAAQLGVFGLILFPTLLIAISQFRHLSFQETNMVRFFVPMFVLITLLSFLSRAHANWAAPAYISGTILVVSFLLRTEQYKWLRGSLILHLVIMALFITSDDILKYVHLSSKTNLQERQIKDPMKRLRGWKNLGKQVGDLSDKYHDYIIVSDERKVIAELFYYIKIKENRPIIKWNSDQNIQDHYELITDLNHYKGRNIMLITRNNNPQFAYPYFTGYSELPPIELKHQGYLVDKYYVYFLYNFKGY